MRHGSPNDYWLHVIGSNQQMLLMHTNSLIETYTISTAANGFGELKNSEMTPRGIHYIRAKIGTGQPINTVFCRRRPTGEVFSKSLHDFFPERDWILTRILWLCGTEKGKNRLGNVDTMQRFVYIHGGIDSSIGIPNSHGCIKMKNTDIINLFNKVSNGAMVIIDE